MRPSKIKRLPREVRETIGRLREQGRTIDEILDHLKGLDVELARSTLGRHIQQVDALAERIRHTRAASEAIMTRLGEGDESRAARLNIELMHANLMDLIGGEEGKSVTLDPQSAMFLGRTLRDLATASRHDTERELKLRKEVAKKAAEKAVEAAASQSEAAGHRLPEAALRQIREQVYGIVGPA